MNNRIDAIYARQSVDKKDSISIESQIEFCKYELKGGNCKEYTDKGYSGKNTDRPKFQELVRDIKRGLIAKVVVYKLDRISRSILDFANMMELFQQYNVEFVSSTEKFDTSTPMGRAMLNICIVFAQLERETIQKRVTDAYYKDMKVEAAPFLQEKTIETTGAGDTFCASSLNYVLEHGLDNLTEENLKELLTFANAAASLITTRKGALRVMSTKEEVLDFMKSRGC